MKTNIQDIQRFTYLEKIGLNIDSKDVESKTNLMKFAASPQQQCFLELGAWWNIAMIQ